MNSRITSRFIIYSIISTISIIVISVLGLYLFFFSGKPADTNYPPYLVQSFTQYIRLDNKEIYLTNEGIELLNKNNAWLQLLDENGAEIYSLNKPDYISVNYKPYEIVDQNLNTKKGADTTYVSEFKNNTIVMGFPGDNIKKITLSYTNYKLNIFIIATIYVILVSSIVFSLMAFIFGRKITLPLDSIINSIKELRNGYLNNDFKDDFHMYKDVFSSLKDLKIKLESIEKERDLIDKKRREWIINISHDIKTPLSTIRGYGEIMAEDTYSFDRIEIVDYSRIIVQQTYYIQQYIEDLRLEINLSHGKVIMRKSETDIIKLLKNIVYEILLIPKYKNRNIEFFSNNNICFISIDEKQIKRAVVNLIINSLNYAGENATTNVNIICEDDVRITISDNGIGMEETEINNLFTRYYRGNNTEDIEGTGLGLSIAKSIIESHNGKIHVKSKVNKGTKILIIL